MARIVFNHGTAHGVEENKGNRQIHAQIHSHSKIWGKLYSLLDRGVFNAMHTNK